MWSRSDARAENHTRAKTTIIRESYKRKSIVLALNKTENTVEFAYNDFGCIVTSPIASHFVGPRTMFCSFVTTVASFLNSLKCKLGCAAATKTFYHRKVRHLRGESLSRGHDQGRNEVRWCPGQEANLAPLCSNLWSFGSKCTVLKKVLVTMLGLFAAIRSHSASP